MELLSPLPGGLPGSQASLKVDAFPDQAPSASTRSVADNIPPKTKAKHQSLQALIHPEPPATGSANVNACSTHSTNSSSQQLSTSYTFPTQTGFCDSTLSLPPLTRELDSRQPLQNKTTWKQDIAVAVVRGHCPFWESAQRMIDQMREIRCVGVFENPASALKSIPHLRPEVLIVDMSLLKLSGKEWIRAFKLQSPRLKILMLTNSEGPDQLFEALRTGVNGFIHRQDLATDLLTAIRRAAEGGAPMSGDVTSRVADFFHHQGEATSEIDRLSPRLRQVLDYLAKGCLYKEIADKLGISYDTVNGYLKIIYDKLHVHSRGEAVAKYLGR